MLRRLSFTILLLFLISACNGQPPAPATPTPTEPSPPLDPTPTATPAVPEQPEESILILEPGPGSRVTSPVRVAGISDPAWEQTLVVRMVLADGTELALEPAQIDAELGERGPFAVDIPFTITGEDQAFIQVYMTSARDGGITHLNSVGLVAAETGPDNIVAVTPHRERIVIHRPAPQATVSGGVAHVEGFGLASFEQNLVVEVQDEMGEVVGSHHVTVQAPDPGQPGPFSVDVAYTVTTAGPGRIAVRDPGAAFPGDVHVTSVEINLEP